MLKYDVNELQSKINLELKSQSVSGRVLLDRFRVIDENSRKTAAYLDPTYSGFYYYLGKHIFPESVMEIGFTLGLLSGTFFTSCKTAKNFFGFKENSSDYSSHRIGKSNIKLQFKKNANFYLGNLYDKEFFDIFSPNSWDLIIINEETIYDKHLEYLDIVWPCLNENGFIIAEYINRHQPARDAFLSFCESKNRQPVMFATRYGTGLLQK